VGNLERGQTYSFDFVNVEYPVSSCDVQEIYEVTVSASGWAPWNRSVTASVTSKEDICEEP
jgi:hypothetical protein